MSLVEIAWLRTSNLSYNFGTVHHQTFKHKRPPQVTKINKCLGLNIMYYLFTI